ncbi:MAG: hypothetical protein IJ678_00730 [Kiritimatiellae bacterium]|nr:hypothetical protein [Kiritimatiellia bacterium]
MSAVPADSYNPDIARRDLKYYIFDWDDNILRMPTYIHMERRLADGSWVPHLVSTALFSVIRKDSERYRPPGGDWEKAFVEFRDSASCDESKFLADARTAIDRLLAGADRTPPSFNTFRKTLREGRIFAIVTARGHRPESLRRGVEMFIDRILTPRERDEMVRNLRGYIVCYEGEKANAAMSDAEVVDNYLSMNRYHAVTNPDFIAAVKAAEFPGADEPEKRKQFAILDFLDWLFKMVERIGANRPISVGFSDDDPGNVAAVADFIRHTLAERFPAVKFVVYDTSDPDVEKGHKLVVSGQLPLF